MGVGLDTIILVVLLFLSGFFSGSEVALVSLTDAKVKQIVDKKRYGSQYVKLLKENPQKMLSAILIGNNIVNIGAASYMTVVMLELFGNHAVSIATGVMTLLVLIFGDIIPKTMATQNADKFSRTAAPFLWYFSAVISPILSILDWFITKFFRLLGVRPKKTTITEEEIKHIVVAAQQEGSIKKMERELITNIFEFDDTRVREICTPFTDMIMVEAKSTVGSAVNVFSTHGFSRLPVYDKHKVNVVGILYLRDTLKRGKNVKVEKVMKTAHFEPEAKKIGPLLRVFQKRKEHMAMVVDEHGTITGLVTLEDVLEELVGEITDESDEFEENIKRLNKTTWVLKGKADIEDVNKEIKMRIPDGDYETIGGFILHKSGKIPKKGSTLTYGKFDLVVEEIRKHRIWTVKVKKK
ncbi:MAG: hemolysin family protein [Candidatus Woesearchaeota archaeon]|nr:hemolysin family protein [Candidatus Woesearchaeota archaeon]